jgi:hypothetical protein
MTVVPSEGGGTVATTDEYENIGLEDIGAGDVVIPRLQILHRDAKFKNNLSGEEYEKLDVILLGLVKQRIFWDEDPDEGDRPKCKSPDFERGFPNTSEDIPKDKRFPWDLSNFNPADFPPEQGLNGLVTLPCASCIFKEWDKGNWKNPPCNEQHTYPLLYTPDEGENWIPALYTVQKTGIKPSRQYISSFAQSKTAMFTVRTTLGLTLQSRGTVEWSVPTFQRGVATEREDWGYYAQQLKSIREFIRQPPRRIADEDEDGVAPAATSNENTAPEPAASAPAEKKSEPKAEAAAAPAAPADDDDLPF